MMALVIEIHRDDFGAIAAIFLEWLILLIAWDTIKYHRRGRDGDDS